MKNEAKKVYTLYAGVNGAGKSTIYNIMKPTEQEKRVNSDEILLSMGGNWNLEGDQWKAMREAAKRVNRYIHEGISFNQETTLAGRTITRSILKAKECGFLIRLYYIGLVDAELAVKRVQQRVKEGGHGIDAALIRKRYDNSLTRLKEILPLCDLAVIYDNTEEFKKLQSMLKIDGSYMTMAVPGLTKSWEFKINAGSESLPGNNFLR
ncbi:MAG: ATPase [Lachnospiraceae bacterium]|nr:ATPase [Lachnospiraceae bacterium]